MKNNMKKNLNLIFIKKPINGVDHFYYKNHKVKTIYVEDESLMVICNDKETLNELKTYYNDFFGDTISFSYLLEEKQEEPLVLCYEWNKCVNRVDELIELEQKETIYNLQIEAKGYQKVKR